MSLFGSQSNASQNRRLLGYRPQTSINGQVIPIAMGTVRVSGNVIWTGNWQTYTINTAGGKGGGKASSGGKGGQGANYGYKTDVIIAMVRGPVQGVLRLWEDKTEFRIFEANETITVPGGGAHAAQAGFYQDIGTARAASYSVTANDYGAPGPVVLAGTQYVPLEYVSGTPGPGQYTVDSSGNYLFNSAQIGQQVQVSYKFTQISGSNDGQPLPNINLTLFSGERGQAAWSHLVSTYGSQALGYTEIAYLAGQSFDLGQSGLLPSLNYEVQAPLRFGGRFQDCDPSDCAAFILTNDSDSAGLSPAQIGSLSEFSTYCVANSIFCSLLMDSQKTAGTWLQDLLTIGNCAPVWSENVLKFRSFGDTTAIGNGVQFTPNTTPVYDLDDDDFLCQQGEEPITVSIPTVRDASNSFEVEWSNRGNAYNLEPCSVKDQRAIELYGHRPGGVVALHEICEYDVAYKTASIILKRSVNVRLRYSFVLGPQYCLLEPMDLVTLTDIYLGLNKAPVRILSIDEDDQFQLSITAEEFPWGNATPALHPKQTSAGSTPGYYAIPGPVNPPLFREATDEMTQGVGHELLIALSGGPDWGGCGVWESVDGATYEAVGRFSGPSVMGTLSASLSGIADPDTTSTLSVSLTESFGALATVSQAAADQNRTLLAIDGELISYETATLTGPNKYDLTYLRRGVFGTPITGHASGAQVASLVDATFSLPYQAADIGVVRYFKFTSFNLAGQQEQSLADVTAYQFRIATLGLPLPWQPGAETPTVSSIALIGQNQSFGVAFDYADVDTSNGLRVSFSGYPPVNSTGIAPPPDTSGATVVLTPTGGTLAPGDYIFALQAFDDTDPSTPGVSERSILVAFTVPAGPSTYKARISGFTFGPHTQGWQSFLGNGDVTSLTASNGVVNPGSLPTYIDVSSLPARTVGPTDRDTDHLHAQGFAVKNGGPWALIVTAAGPTSNQIELAGADGFSVNQFAGYPVELIPGGNGAGSPAPIALDTITSNDPTTGTITLADGTGWVVNIGDIILCHFKLATATDDSFSDPNIINAIYPGGNTDDDNGAEVWVMKNGFVEQIQTVDSNTTTGYKIKGTFDPPITLASQLLIVYPSPVYDTEGTPFVSVSQIPAATIPTVASITAAYTSGQTVLFRIFSESVDGKVNPALYPVRMIWVAGQASIGLPNFTVSGGSDS